MYLLEEEKHFKFLGGHRSVFLLLSLETLGAKLIHEHKFVGDLV